MMPYVIRNSGVITEVYKFRSSDDQEFITDTDLATEQAAIVVNHTSATKLKIYDYLESQGQWAAIETALNANPAMLKRWEYASKVDIDDASVVAMKAVLGWTDSQVQDLFNAVNA